MFMTAESDAQLIASAQGGDAAAFRALVLRHEGKVAGIVKGMLGDIPEAADVGQEVFISFYKTMDAYKGTASLATYLGRIAINLALNALQRRKRQQARFVAEDLAIAVGDREAEMRQEAKEIVSKALAELEPDFRAVLVLRLIQGYSTQETAEMLDLPQGTVLSRLSRGQEKLKLIIQKLMPS